MKTKMTTAWQGAALVGVMGLALGCVEPTMSGEVSVRVVAPNADYSAYALRTEAVENVVDVHQLHHEKFRFLGGGMLRGDEMESFLSSETNPRQFAVKTRSGFKQSINPYLEVRDGVVHGKEFDSMMALTAFAGMAPIWDWYEKQIGDSSVATQEPGFVVFYGDIVPSVWLPVPLVQMDNAVYLAGVDVWMIFPVGNQEGVPYAMNRGVLAHEFHHRIFFQNVWATAAFERWKSLLSATGDMSSEEQRSLNLLRALDEGLADIHAIGYTGNIRFMEPSFSSEHLQGPIKEVLEAERIRRNIESDFADEATYDNLAQDDLNHELFDGCGLSNDFEATGDILSGQAWSPYCLGSVVARTLWDGVGRDHDQLVAVLLPSVNATLALLGDELAKNEPFDLDVFFEILLQVLPSTFQTQNLCEAIEMRFQSLATAERIPSCVF